jgi:hypothetical protein
MDKDPEIDKVKVNQGPLGSAAMTMANAQTYHEVWLSHPRFKDLGLVFEQFQMTYDSIKVCFLLVFAFRPCSNFDISLQPLSAPGLVS